MIEATNFAVLAHHLVSNTIKGAVGARDSLGILNIVDFSSVTCTVFTSNNIDDGKRQFFDMARTGKMLSVSRNANRLASINPFKEEAFDRIVLAPTDTRFEQ